MFKIVVPIFLILAVFFWQFKITLEKLSEANLKIKQLNQINAQLVLDYEKTLKDKEEDFTLERQSLYRKIAKERSLASLKQKIKDTNETKLHNVYDSANNVLRLLHESGL